MTDEMVGSAGAAPAASIVFSGTVTLASGTIAQTISGVLSTDHADVSLISAAGGTLGVSYQAACTANTLTVTSKTTANATANLDTSILFYTIYR